MRPKWLILSLVVLLGGCAFFPSHYDAVRQENFTKLYAFHTKFIEDFADSTRDTTRAWNVENVRHTCDEGDLKFREALVYARTQDNDDSTGTRAVRILMKRFKAHCDFAREEGKPFSRQWAKRRLADLDENYGLAIEGELSRVGVPVSK